MGKDTKQMKDHLLLLLKGMGMGAADVVPGVSGGTIAFIEGNYDELLYAIKSINRESLALLLKGKFREFWTYIHGTFLLMLVLGIGISVFTLAKAITWLLADYPVLVWAFFFGLVVASALLVGRSIKGWNWKAVVALLLGAGAAYYVAIATPAETPTHLLFILLCGAIAICAMILPGISGSFILVLLGKYAYLMEAIKELKLAVLLSFGIGAVVGITTFSRVLSLALTKARNVTLAALTGFMIGSLGKVWPWKETVETYIDSHGAVRPLIEVNVAPNEYVVPAIALMLLGFALVLVLEAASKKGAKQ